MNVAPIIARLREQLVKPGILAACDGVDNIEEAVEQLKAARPTAFVMFTGENAGPNNEATRMVRQKVAYRFMVAIGCPGAGTKGRAKGAALEDLRDQVKDVLIGWQPEGCSTPVIYAGARTAMKNTDAAILFSGVEFLTSYQLRSEETNA